MIDLSTTIGGRKISPALPIVDGSSSTPPELQFNETLTTYISTNIPLESQDGIRTRERVLVKMGKLHREWVQSVALKKGLNVDAVESAGGELFTSGSYRYVCYCVVSVCSCVFLRSLCSWLYNNSPLL